MEAEAEDRAAALVENTAMSDAADSTGENVEVVERFLAAFDRRWPAEDELAELVGPDILFTEQPNLINPGGSELDRAAMRAGLEAGRRLLAWQSYEVRDHVANGREVNGDTLDTG